MLSTSTAPWRCGRNLSVMPTIRDVIVFVFVPSAIR
jgi:hypothetical protein